jgi:hypothetical protein
MSNKKRAAVAADATATKDSPSWSAQFLSFLKEMEPLGTFATCSKIEGMPEMYPKVAVDSVGQLGFPVMNLAIEPLKAVATLAPFEPGDESMVEESVRKAWHIGCKTWQIDASKVTLGGDGIWGTFVQSLVHKSCRELGISDARFEDLKVHFKLSKLMVQECGGHFAPQCNFNSEPGMFAIMLLQLPSQFSDGAMTVSHGGDTKTFDLSDQSGNQFKRIVLFADCTHSQSEVTAGAKVYLVFSLMAANLTSVKPSHSSNVKTLSAPQSFASSWKADSQSMEKLGFPLDHKLGKSEEDEEDEDYDPFLHHYYQNKHRLFGTLTGHDDIVFQTLVDAKSCDGVDPLFDVRLVVMELKINDEQDEVYSNTMQVYDCHGTRLSEHFEMYSHSDGWWIDYDTFARLNPHYKKDMHGWDWYLKFPGYNMYYQWGYRPHVIFADAELERGNMYESYYYAPGVVIARPE